MTAVNATKPFKEFNYWFTRIDDTMWRVYDNSMPRQRDECQYTYREGLDIVYDSEARDISGPIADAIAADFQDFKEGRPEYLVGKRIHLGHLNNEAQIQLYENLLLGVALIRADLNGADVDAAAEKVANCINWLRTTDFYSAPASSIYHESYHGGLIYHTLKVVNEILDLRNVKKFQSVSLHSAVLVALVHDWCKIGLYEKYTRNVKNDETGQWEKVDAYKRKDPLLPLGHGVASMFLSRSYFRLSTSEALAIRWHMGEYNVASNEMNELHTANEQYPLVQLLQFADRLSITAY